VILPLAAHPPTVIALRCWRLLPLRGHSLYPAYVLTGLGDYDRAMELLERSVAEHTGPVYSIKGSFLLKPLHGHPRFQALLRQMKLE
jgi:hypothetical protein